MLSQETDALEDNNKFLDQEIEKYQLLTEQNEAIKQRKIKELKDHKEDIAKDIKLAQNECDNIQHEFDLMKDNV